MDERVPPKEMKTINGSIQRGGSEVIQRFRGVDFCPWIPARYALSILGFLGFFNVYALRVNLSVAIVQMDNSTSQSYGHSARTFSWSDEEEGWILAAFFYGYFITQVPGGWLAERIGGKWVFGIGVVMTSVFTLVTPLAALSSVKLLIAVRVLEGFFEGVTFPAMHAMMGRWAPPKERTRMASITYSGPYVGNVLSFPLSALLCQYGFDGGWPSVFYVFGTLGVVWFIFWIVLAHSTPEDHPRISPAERLYIESSLASENSVIKGKIRTPWLKIFTSRPVWGLVIVYFTTNWGFYTLLTCMPLYIKQTLGCSNDIPIVLNGVYSAIPYLILAIFTLLSGPTADFIRSRWISTTATRKLFDGIALGVGAIFLLLCGYLSDSIPEAITYLSVSVGIGGLVYGGHCVNHLDIGATHAGVLMGISNMVATIPGFVGPQVAKLIAKTPNYPKCSPEYVSILKDEWRQVLIVSAEIMIAGVIIFAILGSGEVQPWAKVHLDDDVTVTSSLNTPEKVKREEEEEEEEKTLLLPKSKNSNYSIT